MERCLSTHASNFVSRIPRRSSLLMKFTADMDEPTHVIDPDGEVIIVLKDANSPFAVWPEEKTEDEKR